MTLGFDPRRALRVLAAHEVDFVVVGGMAASVHGSDLMTYDLDICYSRATANLERLVAALRELNATLRGVDEDVPFLLDAKTIAAGQNFTFVTDAGPLDVLGLPSGTSGYDELAAGATMTTIADVEVPVVSLDDLIAMKRAAGRPKDRFAVENLIALRDELEGEP